MTDRLDEIRRLIREATPGPWRWGDNQHGEGRVLGVDGDSILSVSDCSTHSKQHIDLEALHEPDARLIAAAPELLAWAAGEIERLREDQRSALSNAWCAGVDDALADVSGGDEYASAINAHANALTNPYATTKDPTP
jgi:hypothetical protein